jgi:hypothetical protein
MLKLSDTDSTKMDTEISERGGDEKRVYKAFTKICLGVAEDTFAGSGWIFINYFLTVGKSKELPISCMNPKGHPFSQLRMSVSNIRTCYLIIINFPWIGSDGHFIHMKSEFSQSSKNFLKAFFFPQTISNASNVIIMAYICECYLICFL